MEKKDLNDISADEIIRRLNKTLGIEAENDSESDDAEESSESYDDEVIGFNDYPYDAEIVAEESDNNASDNEEDFPLIYPITEDNDTTLSNIFKIKKNS